jgi:4'-phosphopantetheinyl transferase EntD
MKEDLESPGLTDRHPPEQPHGFIRGEPNNPGFAGPISVYCCQFALADYTDELFAHYGIAFPPSLHKAVAKRRAEFLAGRYCARQSLLPLGYSAVDIPIGPHRSPHWPAAITGSISHCRNYAIAVTTLKSNLRGIGVDIEEEVNADTCEKIKGQVLFGEELRIFDQFARNASGQAFFTAAFSAKESFFKAAYPEVGKYFDFSAVSILAVNQQDNTILMEVNETLSEGLRAGVRVTADYRMLSARVVVTLVKLGHTP